MPIPPSSMRRFETVFAVSPFHTHRFLIIFHSKIQKKYIETQYYNNNYKSATILTTLASRLTNPL